MGIENLGNPKTKNPSSDLIIKNPVDSNLGINYKSDNKSDKVLNFVRNTAGFAIMVTLVLFAVKYTLPLFEKNVPPTSPLSEIQVKKVSEDLANFERRQADESKAQEKKDLNNVKKVVEKEDWDKRVAN